jgi:serine/threonine-protein kinase RsbW
MLRSRLQTDQADRTEVSDRDHEVTNPEEPFIELRIPPDPAYVRVARLAAGDMGGRVGFSVDELDDVRLAVDELCAVLIGAGGHVLELRMQARDRTLIIEGCTAEAKSPTAPSELSEMLIRALVDSCVITTQAREVRFEMHKLAREIV